MEKETKTAQQLIQRKTRGIVAVEPEDTVFTALERMAEQDIGSVLVMKGDRLAGIVTERDYARKVELQGKTATKTRVRDIMTAKGRVRDAG
jgi:CBS domain-containing protein